MIDNHNSLWMHPLSIEKTRMTAHWPHCVFCFLLAMTVVNIQNGGAFFCAIPKLDALSARRKMAREFIYNRYLIVEQSPSRKCPHHSAAEHCLITLPTQKKIFNGKLSACKSRHGHAPVWLPMLGHTVHAVQESLYVLNVMQLIGLTRQWLFLLIHNSVFSKFPFLETLV